jgi:cytochrome bd-type quinol oxidase subunit 1
MKKLIVLVLVLAAFLAVLTFYIVPQQGGLISSTELKADDLQKADQQYEEDLPIQEVGMGRSGRSIIIALVMLSHVLYANLHLGGSWVAAITESLHLRNRKERYRRLARSVTLFNVMLFSAGATFAVAGVLFFISLYPTFAKELFHIYWWPLLLEAIAFALEIFFLYTYWFTWDKIRPGWHQFLGYGYAVDVFLQTLLINMVAGGMLTPGGDTIAWGQTGLMPMAWSDAIAWWINGTVFRLQFHRLAAAISYFGFLLAMLAMFHYLDRKDAASKRYWDWAGSYGMAWGLLGLVFQPVFGLVYMLAINDNQPDAFEMIMHGSRAWEMLLMVGLLSSLFLTIITYFIDRRERILTQQENRMLHTLFKIFLIVAAVCALVLIQPAWLGANSINDPNAWANPLGVMDYKYVALFALVVIGALVLMLDAIMLGDTREAEWGNLSGVSRTAAIMAGILGMWIVIVMGYARESARSPWTIFKVVPVPGGQSYPTPVPISQIFIVWAVVSVAALLVFWFTSKVTAHHPEEAEEV